MTAATIASQNFALALSCRECLGTINCRQPFTQLRTAALDLNRERALRRRTRDVLMLRSPGGTVSGPFPIMVPRALPPPLATCWPAELPQFQFNVRATCVRAVAAVTASTRLRDSPAARIAVTSASIASP